MENSLAYVIEAGAACDVSVIRDAFTRPVYGSTLLERNLKFLRKEFPTIQVILSIRPDAESEIRPVLEELLAAGKMRLHVADDLDQLDWLDGRTACPSVNAVLLQYGVRLLERVDWKNRTYHCAPGLDPAAPRPGKTPLSGIILQMRRAHRGCRGFSFLVQDQKSCEAIREGAQCVSISEVTGHDFSATGASVATELSAYLHARAGLRSMDGPVSRLLLRNFSQYLSRPMSRWGVHPNAATLAAAACALAAIFLFTFDSRQALVAGGVMWMIGGLLDEVDGELARLQGKESEFGAWLDLTFDRILDGLVLIALAWPVVVANPAPHLLMLIATAITLIATNSYIGLLYDSWMKNVLGRTVYFRIGRDTRNLVIFLCAVFALRMEAIWIAGAFSLLEILRRLVVCYRMDPAASSKDNTPV